MTQGDESDFGRLLAAIPCLGRRRAWRLADAFLRAPVKAPVTVIVTGTWPLYSVRIYAPSQAG